jgi:hypothetical protein
MPCCNVESTLDHLGQQKRGRFGNSGYSESVAIVGVLFADGRGSRLRFHQVMVRTFHILLLVLGSAYFLYHNFEWY